MPKFLYKVKDIDGKLLVGALEAENERSVRHIITEKGYFVINVQKMKKTKLAGFGKPVSIDSLIRFTHKLSAMFKAGVPILTALRMLWEQGENKYLQIITSEIITDISQGELFSDSLRKFPEVFSEIYISLVQVSESSGDFPQALEQIIAHLNRQKEIRRKVQNALMYPIIVVVMIIAVIIAMLVIVIPVFKKIFSDINVDLPFITRMFIFLSDNFIRYWWVGFVITGVLVFVYRKYKKTPRGAYKIDECKLRIPTIGQLIYYVALSKFIHSFYALSVSGVEISKTLASSARSCANRVLEGKISSATESIVKGKSISRALQEAGCLPAFFVQMLSIGETSGSILNMMKILMTFLDDEIDFQINKIFTILGPATIIIVGFIVLFVLLAIYFPIFTLWGNIG
ncbi:MAG: type II secretion system F family protein [Candidatus Aceula meridiana]|nr:type II secretion system F family protein [Candidatus Aceula meridiana]